MKEIRNYAADASQYSNSIQLLNDETNIIFVIVVALQEHVDDDLQVDGPGETDNEADPADDPPPPPRQTKPVVQPTATETSDQDTAQIAKKIKGLINSKVKPSAKEETVVPPEVKTVAIEPTEPVKEEELQRSDSAGSVRSQGSLSGKSNMIN